ncbi:hypothetical protein FRC06_008588 [Ceratobasidium sp. 370]|nr:hypothetical protein FRC06_008588 [Ceratobasidium sp. 370]
MSDSSKKEKDGMFTIRERARRLSGGKNTPLQVLLRQYPGGDRGITFLFSWVFDLTLYPMKIENVLFNVHKYQLMKSETFSDMFETAGRDPEEGSSPEKPIVMEGVSASDFECLLTVLYATRFSTYQPVPEASLIIPAFRLANKWNFEDLRNYLLPLAEKELSDIDKIVFAREFGIKAWLAPAHTNLCQRKEPLTTDEAVKLGVHSLLLISRLREEVPRPAHASATYLCGPCAGYTIYGSSSGQYCNICSSYGRVVSPQQRTSNDESIGAKVKKWVDDGCVFSA